MSQFTTAVETVIPLRGHCAENYPLYSVQSKEKIEKWKKGIPDITLLYRKGTF